MQFLSIVALASATFSTPVEPLTKRNFCFLYNNQDCRDFTLYQVPTDQIENHIIIGDETNVPAGLSDFHGVWYMNGNPLADECLSFAKTVANADGTWTARVYDENIWSWDPNFDGKVLYDAVRTFALTYVLKKVTNDKIHVTPTIFTPNYLLGQKVSIGDMLAEFEIVRTADPNLWLRPSSFFGHYVGSYNFTRIVYGNGTRTERYYTDYLPNVNNPQKKQGVTLLPTQLLAKAAQ
ncbi:hypothetical protein HDV04_004054 [Boothiomyces sp. JEL0838]|nr:hypothetical protein HDV04_004054 [Boothiomyces sp. JEL0838]